MDSDDNIKDLAEKISFLERHVKNLQNTRNEFFIYLGVMMLFFGFITLIFPQFTFMVFFITAFALFFLSTDKPRFNS